MTRHADGQRYLKTECLAHLPLPYDAVNSAYIRAEVPQAELKRLCLSHERLRAELQGLEIIHDGDAKRAFNGVIPAATEIADRWEEIHAAGNIGRPCEEMIREIIIRQCCIENPN